MRATARAAESTYAGIVRLVSEAEESQAPFVRLADRYALWFLLVSLARGRERRGRSRAPERAVAVLVVATPCPLILAAPVALVSGMSVAARRGVVVKGRRRAGAAGPVHDAAAGQDRHADQRAPGLAAVVPAGASGADESCGWRPRWTRCPVTSWPARRPSAARQRGCALTPPEQRARWQARASAAIVAGHEVTVGKAAWCGIGGPAGPPWAKAARRRARLDGALTVFVGRGRRAGRAC